MELRKSGTLNIWRKIVFRNKSCSPLLYFYPEKKSVVHDFSLVHRSLLLSYCYNLLFVNRLTYEEKVRKKKEKKINFNPFNQILIWCMEGVNFKDWFCEIQKVLSLKQESYILRKLIIKRWFMLRVWLS